MPMTDSEKLNDRIEAALNWQSGLSRGEGWQAAHQLLLDLRDMVEDWLVDPDDQVVTVCWKLTRKVETERDVRCFFERVVWWTGEAESSVDAEPGATGAKSLEDRGMGAMVINLDHNEAAQFQCGLYYTFTTNAMPVEEGDS